MLKPEEHTPSPSRHNINAIAKLEHDALRSRTRVERFSETTVKAFGSLVFLFLNIVVMIVWILFNTGGGPFAFDRFPFGILALALSGEGIILTIFVLISQNRLVRQAEKRAHLDLQVGLLAEQEITALVEMVHQLCEKAGVEIDYSKHAENFVHATDVHKIAKELDETLPSE